MHKTWRKNMQWFDRESSMRILWHRYGREKLGRERVKVNP